MENQENAQPEVAQTQDQGAPPQPELTITDLINLRSVVDVAVRRGAFGATEISSVGAVFDKLNVFLNTVAPPKQESAPDESVAAQ
jgi:hypothetical protein